MSAMLVMGKKLAVFSIRDLEKEKGGGSVWTRAGSAFVNKDGSLNLRLDVLPIDGRLHVREAADRRDQQPAPQAVARTEIPLEHQPVGGHS